MKTKDVEEFLIHKGKLYYSLCIKEEVLNIALLVEDGN